jgi:GH25 family lysozyme M1 (1,4-beta-N-acetylmuramidase)
MTFEVNGYDVSKWQGEINWNIFGTKGDFFIIRAGSIDNVTGRCYEDYQFHRNAKLGIPFGKPMGAYWYFRPQFSGIIQADYFSKLVEKYPFKIKASLDGEENAGLSPNQVTSSAWVFMNRLKRNLGDGMIYTSPGFWSYTTTWANLFDLWDAQWPGTDAQKPIIPKDWSSHKKTARFWQWKVGDNGQELGFGIGSKGVDMDRFMGTRAEFDALYNATPIPDPTPEPTPLTIEQRVGILEREAGYHGWDLTSDE